MKLNLGWLRFEIEGRDATREPSPRSELKFCNFIELCYNFQERRTKEVLVTRLDKRVKKKIKSISFEEIITRRISRFGIL